MSREQEQKTPSFSEIRQRLQAGEDFDVAYRLQEQEYEMFYNRNRNVNGTIVSDRKKTRAEQTAEDERSAALRRLGLAERCLTDEEYARQLQEEMNRIDASKQMDKEAQLKEDERLAWMLQQELSNTVTSTTENLISFDDQVPSGTQFVTELEYNNMANRFLEEQPAPAPPPVHLINLSPTNPFLHDVEEYYSQISHHNY